MSSSQCPVTAILTMFQLAFKGTCVVPLQSPKLDPESKSKVFRKTLRGTFDFIVLMVTQRYMILHFWSAGRMAVFSLNYLSLFLKYLLVVSCDLVAFSRGETISKEFFLTL